MGHNGLRTNILSWRPPNGQLVASVLVQVLHDVGVSVKVGASILSENPNANDVGGVLNVIDLCSDDGFRVLDVAHA